MRTTVCIPRANNREGEVCFLHYNDFCILDRMANHELNKEKYENDLETNWFKFFFNTITFCLTRCRELEFFKLETKRQQWN